MCRSGGIKQDSASPQLPAPKSRFRGPFRLLVSAAVLFVTVVFIFPVVFEPSVEPPAPSPFASPFSIVVRISNQDVTPLMDVEYSCEVSKLALANGSIAGDAKVLVRGAIRKMPGRQAIAARCETANLRRYGFQHVENVHVARQPSARLGQEEQFASLCWRRMRRMPMKVERSQAVVD